jgi:2-methylcitrate dehydratase PrpD
MTVQAARKAADAPRAATTTDTVSGRFAAFIHGLTLAALPRSVVEKTKVRLLDCLGTGLAARGLHVPGVALAFIDGNTGPATVLGQRQRVPLIDAAFVNATLINGRSEDDFLQKSHPGALTIPSALAVAEDKGLGGADVLVALVAGYEIVGRVYLGGPTMLPRFRASGVAGTVGAAATAAKLLGLDAARTMNALGCGAMFAHGFGEGFRSGTNDVKLNVGMASRNGMTAARLAEIGATASPTAFEGEAGFYRAFSNTIADVAEATRGLGERYLIEEAVYKECPVCIFTQTPIALARSIAAEVDPAQIERVFIRAPELTYTNPGFTNVAPYRTHLQAVVSARFCTAAALLGKPVETHDFYDHMDDREVLALAEKIELESRPSDNERVDIEVVQRDGSVRAGGIEHDTLYPTAEKVVAKFRRLTAARPRIPAEKIIEAVMNLENVRDIHELTDLLQD